MTAVKICCIQSEKEAALALNAGANAIGLVAEMPSGPGPIADTDIAHIIAAFPDALTVLLTSRTETDPLIAHVRTCRPRAVQLVDYVTPATTTALRKAMPDVQIFQVIHVAGEADIARAQTLAETADFLLLDSGAPDKAIKELGGTGRTHNWAISRQIVAQSPVPVWLAGGLNPDNVADAIKAVRPHGVDVCSGLRPDGALDPRRLDTFLARVAS